MALESMKEILTAAQEKGMPFWEVILTVDMDEREVTREQSLEKMRMTWKAMLESALAYEPEEKSLSGLVGGDAEKMRVYAASGKALGGTYVQDVMINALRVSEANACMRRIVAAPTAGSCGVLPAVLVPLYQSGAASEDDIVKAMYVASGIGAVISFRACIAGAAGGCQAEVGAASAMAAGLVAS